MVPPHRIGTAHFVIDLAIAVVRAAEERTKTASPVSKLSLLVRIPSPTGHFFRSELNFCVGILQPLSPALVILKWQRCQSPKFGVLFPIEASPVAP